ncbi:GlxA family transcriptional regulator [Agromyces atrinae]|uniref:AraC family transcriptional regulator n=1 Tax=Agromyces atrinae TaxID=592376 RepID=A0A4Q2MDC8_9MICO|nr:AraC family transcriptional regulator [Agromyces atrinae]NYD67657.1 transcriptional regulator GlxA family with amidase domain [Agromyces atrinae]RXZ88141.1 AraC family transcriptional regulator [Agromyces atrinae]
MKIAVYAFDAVTMFHLAVPQMVFDEVDRLGLASWKTVLFSDRGGSVRTDEGYVLSRVEGIAATEDADLIVIPSWIADGREPRPALRRALLAAHARGVTIVGLCLGAIVVADIGLLDGRSAVTHWHSVDELARKHPGVDVDADVLYLDHGDVLTSAGTASGIDACLHIVRTRLGAEAANTVARSLVVAPHREGGQAQYIERAVAPRATDDPIAVATTWALQNLGAELTIESLASAAHMSRRTFVRTFRNSMGVTPAAWVRSRRLDEARRLLETSNLSIDQIAASCGFGNPVTLRQNFSAAFGSTPSNYRRRFDARPV